MLDFRIESFLAVCKHMNFTKAAKELNLTQPAVSQHIHYLEELYHTKLFAYEGKKMSLTEVGEILYHAATVIQYDAHYLEKFLSEYEHYQRNLIFGATRTIGEFMLPERLASFMETCPKSKISMQIGNTRDLLQKLDRGEIDFAFIEGFFSKNDYASISYQRENFIAVCSPDLLRKQKEVYRLEDLLPYPLIIREVGSGSRELLQRSLESRNLTERDFSNVIEIGSINALKKLVERKLGVTFIFEIAVEEELANGTLKKIKVKDLIEYQDMAFVWRKNSVFSEEYQEFFSLLYHLW